MSSISLLTIGDTARVKAVTLARELGIEHLVSDLHGVLQCIGEDWFEREVGDAPLFDTDITDDGSPFELSVALEGSRAELRVLAEAQQAPYDLHSNWRAGLRATERLAREHDLDLSRFRRVSDLFVPSSDAAGRFAMWHAVAISETRAALLKIYLNPSAQGAGNERRLVEEAFARLGLQESWSFVARKLDQSPQAKLAFFALDLHAGEGARVKVYVAYPGATAAVVDAAIAGSAGYRSGEATRFIRQVTGRAGPFTERPLLVCHAFSAELPAPSVTLHVPVRCYVPDDSVVLESCAPLVPAWHQALGRALTSLAGRSLAEQAGVITYASLRSGADSRRLTLYLAPQLYAQQRAPSSSVIPPRHSYLAPRRRALASAPTSLTMLTVQDAISRARLLLRQHPFIQRLERGAELEQLRSMTRALTFYVMSFQDMLRLSRMSISDPTLRAISAVHEREDRGHEQWFLHDAQRMGSSCDLRTVFSSEYDVVRDVSYSLIAEVLCAEDDRQRLAVVLCLEAAGGEFFQRVIALLERLGLDEGLRYFARSHQAIEDSHEVFESDTQLTLASIPAPAEVLALVLQSVERSFVAMAQLADEMERVMRCSQPSRSVA